MSPPLAALFCPGRGSYAREELGFLRRHLRPGPVADALAEADAERKASGQPSITELDGADRFRPGLHLDGENAAALIYFSTLAHVEHLRERYRIELVAGNSLGWYTALAAAGALSPAAGWRLVSTMARLQKGIPGGQILTTTVDEAWRRDPSAAAAVREALDATNAKGEAFFVARSIRLGGHEVLAGTEAGIRHLLGVLPRMKVGERDFPFQLAGHGPFHTRLCQPTSDRAAVELASLPMTAPVPYLVDGLGNIHSPWSADPSELLSYTVTTQVTETYDFTAAVRTAIREFNPEILLCAGPGASLRAPVGHVAIAEGYRGLADRNALFESQLVSV